MNRRNALSFLGLGSLAGPSIGKELISASPSQHSEFISTKAENPVETLSRLKSELANLDSDPAKWIFERASQDMKDYMMGYPGISYNQIDPDIRNMKSITESAKMRIYYERRAKRSYESQKESLTYRITNFMGILKS